MRPRPLRGSFAPTGGRPDTCRTSFRGRRRAWRRLVRSRSHCEEREPMKASRRLWLRAAWFGCLALVAAGCRAADSAGSNNVETIKLAFVTNNSAGFWTIARRGVEKAHAELTDVDVEFRLTSPADAAEQQRI